MNKLDLDYQNLLKDILENGTKKETRNGGTLSVFGREIRFNFRDGKFPLLTTKKMYFKGIVTELLFFLRGNTNIKYLVDNDCHIWDGDAYKRYWNSVETSEYDGFGPTSIKLPTLTQEEFINKIKTDNEFAKKWGDLGPVYGYEWRKWGEKGDQYSNHNDYTKGIDQIANLIHDLKNNPDSRRLMVTAWNPADIPNQVLPPCHYGFQVYTRELSLDERESLMDKIYGLTKETRQVPWHIVDIDKANIPTRAISLKWNQRSVDTFLGLPFNIASYGLLLEILAKTVNMVPDELIGTLGDTHLYLNHIEQAKEQIGRELSLEERYQLVRTNGLCPKYSFEMVDGKPIPNKLTESEWYDKYNIPTRTRHPFDLPTLKMGPIFLANLEHKGFDEAIKGTATFEVENYQSHPTIKAKLSN